MPFFEFEVCGKKWKTSAERETNGLIKTRTFKGFLWQYEYYPNTKLVKKITDKDGQSVTYTYDHLLRLDSAKARNNAVITKYTYKYKDAAQSNKSWVETKTTFTSFIGGLLSNNTTFKTVRQYLDGLGRPVQNVAVANSPNLKDVISVIEYDNQGREFKKYDPFESTKINGAYETIIPNLQPFAKMEYDSSPLNRIRKTTPPGWQPTYTEYATNLTGDAYDMTGTAYYPPNTLQKVTRTDPDGRVQKIFTDRKGRKVFTLNVQNNVAGGYYMIYSFDDKDRMNKVFTPRNAWQEWWNANDLDYSYRYDYNDNMIYKKLPDIAAVNMQYNARNQLVLMQDGKQASLNPQQWLATQYDTYGRPAATGFANSTNLDIALNPYFTSTLTSTDYSYVAGTELGKPIRTYNYFGTYLESFLQYDSYGRLSSTYSNNQLYSPSGAISTTNFSEKIALTYDLADNVLTKTRTHKPNATTTRTIVETMDYDNGLRLKQMKHKIDAMDEQILNNVDYSIKNQITTKRMGKVGTYNYLQKVDYTYNSLGWLTGINTPAPPTYITTNPIGNYPALISPNSSSADLDNNDLLSMEFKYDNPNSALAPSGTIVKGEYNGNISQVIWQVRGREKQAYTLSYDAVNRMTNAKYSDINNSGVVTGGRYDETLTYDIRGNINTLQRYGLTSVAGAPSPTWGLIDNLTYNYGSSGYNIKNKLNSVTDNSGNLTKGFKTSTNGSAYTYDSDGNMTSDPNKNITGITYNYLNLPITITFTGSRSITFMYDAGGNKLRKTVVQGGTTPSTTIQDYVGGFEYKNNVLEAIYHSEGRVTMVNSVLKYEYALKDQLGNTRIMFCDKDGNGIIGASSSQEASEITQENHYYPYGMNMEGTWQNTPSVSDSKYLYNGKELNDDFGLGLMDYGARMYDAAIGRWHVVDPLSDKYYAMTPYNYVGNNPTNFIDPNGMESEGLPGSACGCKKGTTGTIKGTDSNGSNAGSSMAGVMVFSGGSLSTQNAQTSQGLKQDGGPGLPVFIVKKSRYKNIYYHHWWAFSFGGVSNIMTYRPDLAARNTYWALKDIPTLLTFHRDEIPYKTTLEGGSNASVAYVPAKENTDHGNDYGQFIFKNKIKSGQQFMVSLVDDTNDEKETEPVPSPTFWVYIRRQGSLFNNMKLAPQFNAPFLFVPFIQGLEWQLPRSQMENFEGIH